MGDFLLVEPLGRQPFVMAALDRLDVGHKQKGAGACGERLTQPREVNRLGIRAHQDQFDLFLFDNGAQGIGEFGSGRGRHDVATINGIEAD